jgi:hypothetical protein
MTRRVNPLFPGRRALPAHAARRRPGLRASLPWLAALAFACGSPAAFAQGFSVLVSPPRFELHARPGDTLREVVQLDNVSNQAAPLQVGSADWTFDAHAAIQFQGALAAGSCRPWLAIEANTLTLPANGKHRYRFQIGVPADAAAGECRLALMFEGAPVDVKGALPIPVSGRIAVIVYVVVGDAAAKLSLVSVTVEDHQGTRLPVLTVRNDGNAHTRLGGFVDATDGSGHRLALQPESLPILPGETRRIALLPVADDPDQPAVALHWPLAIRGTLDAGAQQLRLDERLAP